jgi:hypothetical protein
MRVALLTNILTPYRLPVYRDLAATPGWQLRVMLCAAEDPSWQRAFAGAHEEGAASLDVEITAGASLRRRGGEDAPRAVGSARLAAPLRTRRDRDERARSAHGVGGRVRGPAPRAARDLELSRAQRGGRGRTAAQRAAPCAARARADAVVGMGRQARDVLRGLGVPDRRLFDAPNSHDAAGLDARLAALDVDAERLALRASLGARSNLALVAGRLEASKGVLPLLVAWQALPAAARAEWTLLFVGDGPLDAAVDDARRASGAGAIARMPALRPDALAGVYAASDLLVFPSLADPWGLVVNEAMACGLPVLCSRLAGCADDLIVPGETGWLCDPTDPQAFRDALAHAHSRIPRAMRSLRARATPRSVTARLRSRAVCGGRSCTPLGADRGVEPLARREPRVGRVAIEIEVAARPHRAGARARRRRAGATSGRHARGLELVEKTPEWPSTTRSAAARRRATRPPAARTRAPRSPRTARSRTSATAPRRTRPRAARAARRRADCAPRKRMPGTSRARSRSAASSGPAAHDRERRTALRAPRVDQQIDAFLGREPAHVDGAAARRRGLAGSASRYGSTSTRSRCSPAATSLRAANGVGATNRSTQRCQVPRARWCAVASAHTSVCTREPR